MSGGTLVISREEKNHNYFKKRLEGFGCTNVTPTALDKDALYMLIRSMKPNFLLMDARFYQCCTPFLMGRIKHDFPKIRMAAFSIGEYPPDIAMYFILNGVTSFVSTQDGIDEFFIHLAEICKGKDYVSPEVMERIKLRREEYPDPAKKITERHKQVIKLICCGFKDHEIADTLSISRNTVVNHKTVLFTSLNVRSPIELVRAALTLEIVRLEELYFYPKGLTVNPKPIKHKSSRGKE